ncbi:FtsX-like permease family protein [Olivibacter sitiensis]|uniref:FtsX-like permease family protein n=1 Tax=Olivibacter sitiensis TaxID=376470 RepID=UPI00041AE6EE|nr:FtsX-like permease family protein [Olivibacter sitiensis]
MLRNHIKIAWRNLCKNKVYTFIHLFGLAIAVTCCLVIYSYIQFHRSYDSFHPGAENIYHVVYDLHLEQTEHSNGTSYAIYNALKTDFPQVEGAAYAFVQQNLTLKHENQLFAVQKGINYSNASWFELFDIPWLQGEPRLLNEPGNIALTSTLAQRIFGDKNPMGQVLYTSESVPLKVVGLVDDSRKNSDLKAEAYVSLESIKTIMPSDDDYFFTFWGYLTSGNQVYIKVADRNAISPIEKSLNEHTKKYFGEEAAKLYDMKLLPLLDQHFDPRYGGTSSAKALWILGTIGLAILLIATLNYINLTTAHYTRRNKEIGTRKVLGSSKGQLIGLFLTESLLISAGSMVLAIVFTHVAIPLLNRFLLENEPIAISYNWQLLLAALLAWMGVSLLSGLYPSFVLARTNAIRALKNQIALGSTIKRKPLLVFQNALAIVLIISCIVVFAQIRYMQSTDMGFDRQNVVTIDLPSKAEQSKGLFKKLLDEEPEVLHYSYCFRAPTMHGQHGGTFQFDNREDFETWPARSTYADSAYLRTFGIPLLAGRNFREAADVPEYHVNRKFVQMLGYTDYQDILGKSLLAGGMHDNKKGVIVGVVEDYNTQVLNKTIEPTVLGYAADMTKTLAIKVNGRHTMNILSKLENQWRDHFPNELFSYHFLDHNIEMLYQSEQRQGKLIAVSAAIAIFISSLGLFGLITLTALQRAKEIGIRKVLGASVSGIVSLLSKDFLKLVLIALLIASPLAWWAMNKWLEDFAYRINLQWWMFALAGLVAIMIALLTVGLQAIRAAVANPVDSLRDE